MLPCLSKQILGIDCLGCGFQRSIVLLFQGQFIDAFSFIFKFKKLNKIINLLAILSVSIIIISFIAKKIN